MMRSNRQKIPLEVLAWANNGSNITKSSVGTGVLPNDSRPNILLNRTFCNNMLSISSKRHRQLTRCQYQMETFLKTQRLKADTTMPGLLPYIADLTKDMERNTSARRAASLYGPLTSSSFSLNGFPKQPSPTVQKREISLERINRLAQPKGHHQRRRQSDVAESIIGSDTFSRIENVSNYYSPVLETPRSPTNDKRFRRLVHLFAEVHQPTASNSQTVKSIVQSKSSLQGNEGQRQMTSIFTSSSDEFEKEPRQSFSTTNGQLIATCS